MKAAIYEKYGPPEVVRIAEVPTPEPKANEVRIKIYAATVSAGDWRLRSLNVPFGFGILTRLLFGIFKPRRPILGTELAGEIDAVGASVARFQPGDQVFAFSGGMKLGGHAEYICMPEDGRIEPKPASLAFAQAAALSFGGTTALHFFRKANLKSGDKVLINGASGSVGSAAVQIARHFGANVTGVCSSANIDLVTSLGASEVIDYRQDNFTKNGKQYDVIMDTVGNAPYGRVKNSLKPGGRLLAVVCGLGGMLRIPFVSLLSNKKIIAGAAAERPEDLKTLAELASSGKFKPVIGRTFPFEQIVAAHREVDSGHKRGNLVIQIVDEAGSE